MQIPEWVVREIGRLNLELLVAQQRIRELEAEREEAEREEGI